MWEINHIKALDQKYVNTQFEKPERVVLDAVIQLAIKTLNPKKIVLFGSRARRDHRERSDYDLAFFQDEISHSAQWSRFCLMVEETAPTLHHIDLLLVTPHTSESMMREIAKEGITLYER